MTLFNETVTFYPSDRLTPLTALDFRSPTGLYAKLKEEGKYDLDDPQQMCVLSVL